MGRGADRVGAGRWGWGAGQAMRSSWGRGGARRRLGVGLQAMAGIALGVVAMAQEGAGPVMVDGWRQAEPGYQFAFPRDHGSHPEYRIEWWYYTGNLAAGDGRRFGYQVTFFRIGVDPAPVNPSRWAVRDLYMAHLAVTDVAEGRQHVAERFDRGGVGWAGADEGTLEVWNGDWRASLDGDAHLLELSDGSFGLELRLDPGRGATLHGEAGFSQKGAQPGNASHYYSMTRMPTTGWVSVDGERVVVNGDSWMDHEFGTSFLEPGQVGWDWFSLQLDDGSDLMLFQLRRDDGSGDTHSAGTWLAADGSQTALVADDFSLTPGRRWSSPTSGAAYPVEWSIELPSRGARLEIAPLVEAQELHTDQSTGVTYWEGAVSVRGEVSGEEVTGRGYLEMTGYVGRPMSEMFR